MNSETIYTLTPVVVNTPILQEDEIPAPTACSATYSAGNSQLTVFATISLPDGETISNVTLEQYYSEEVGLQFYFVFNFSNPTFKTPNLFPCKFIALDKDASGNTIPLSKLNTLIQLIQDIDPKTSRGTRTTITHVTDN